MSLLEIVVALGVAGAATAMWTSGLGVSMRGNKHIELSANANAIRQFAQQRIDCEKTKLQIPASCPAGTKAYIPALDRQGNVVVARFVNDPSATKVGDYSLRTTVDCDTREPMLEFSRPGPQLGSYFQDPLTKRELSWAPAFRDIPLCSAIAVAPIQCTGPDDVMVGIDAAQNPICRPINAYRNAINSFVTVSTQKLVDTGIAPCFAQNCDFNFPTRLPGVSNAICAISDYSASHRPAPNSWLRCRCSVTAVNQNVVSVHVEVWVADKPIYASQPHCTATMVAFGP